MKQPCVCIAVVRGECEGVGGEGVRSEGGGIRVRGGISVLECSGFIYRIFTTQYYSLLG